MPLPEHEGNDIANAKVAIVTAASRGIGAACTRCLHERGYKLALFSRSEAVEVLAETLNALAVRGSVRSKSDLQNLVEATIIRYGRIDVVINNTGDAPRGELLELSDDDWQSGFELYLRNAVYLAQLVTGPMRAQGGGSIINISAADAYEPDLRFPLGSTFRAALGAFTKLYANRYAADNIRMNCVLPGITFDHATETIRPDIKAEVPMQRPGYYHEIGRVAAFLVSEESSYVTGQNWRVDGGLTKSV